MLSKGKRRQGKVLEPVYNILCPSGACGEGLSLTTMVAVTRRRMGPPDHDGDSKEGRVHSVGHQLEPALLADGPAGRGALLAGKANLVAER